MGFLKRKTGAEELMLTITAEYCRMYRSRAEGIRRAKEFFAECLVIADQYDSGPNGGDRLLAAAGDGNEEAREWVATCIAGGASEKDVRDWYNQSEFERVLKTKATEAPWLAMFMHAYNETGSEEEAGKRVWKFHVRYFPLPADPEPGDSEDRSLPVVLYDRVERYTLGRRRDPQRFKAEIENSSTFNALVRREMSAGRL